MKHRIILHSMAGAMLAMTLALSIGCTTVDREAYTQSRISNYSDTAIEVKLVFDSRKVFGQDQPQPAEVKKRLDAFATGKGVTVVSIEPGLLMNSPNKAIAGIYRIEPAGFMIVDSSQHIEPHFAFDEMTVTTQSAIMGHHTRESVRQEFQRGKENGYEYKVGALDSPVTPSHLTQAEFETKLNEDRASLTGDGMEIIREYQGKLPTGASHEEDLPALNSDWLHYALVIGDGSFMRLDVRDQHHNPAHLLEREIISEPDSPAAAFAPSPETGHSVTVAMDDCPAVECNFALMILQGLRRAPPQYPPLDMSEISVGPDNTISWEHAKMMIQRGNVEYVYQSHSRHVGIHMANGEHYQTTEPEIDAVIRWVEDCGKKDWIAIMVE